VLPPPPGQDGSDDEQGDRDGKDSVNAHHVHGWLATARPSPAHRRHGAY
jgi:hypothetical protein